MTPALFARTYSSKSLNELFYKADNDDIRHLQYNMICSGLDPLPLEVPQEVLVDIQKELMDPGISLIGLSATYNMIHPNPREVARGRQALSVLAIAADQLKIPVLTMCTGTRNTDNKWRKHEDNGSSRSWSDLLSEMEKALKIAEPRNLILGVEPEPGNVMNSASTALELIREMQSDHLKVILDAANLFEEAERSEEVKDLITEAMDLLHDHLVQAHAKDRKLSGEVVPTGQGDVDFIHFIELLDQAGYDGPMVMHSLPENEVPSAQQFLLDTIKSVRS